MQSRHSFGRSACALAAASALITSFAQADDYTFNVPAGGSQGWQVPANWTSGTGVTFPNSNLDTANLSIALAANLALDVGATNVTVGAITMGGTGGAVTSDIVSTGGVLFLDNAATDVTITSQGVAGSVNRISASTVLLDRLLFGASSTQALSLVGPIQMNGGNREIVNNAPGAVLKLGDSAATEIRTYDFTDSTLARTLTLNGVANSVTEINGTFVRGPNNVGSFAYSTSSSTNFATFIYNAPQTINTALHRSTYVVNDNLAFGPGTLTAAGAGTLTATSSFTASNGNQANWAGTITSTKSGGVTIPNLIYMGNSLAFAGSENIVISGALTQGNNRAMGNAMSAGATLTLQPDGVNNTTGISIGISRQVADGNRTWIVEGTGTTIINGKVVNNLTDDSTIVGAFEKRGSGRVELNNGGNTIRGEIRARGGNLVFGVAGSWGTPTGISVQANGGIWYAPGVGAAGWDDGPNSLLAKILNTSTGFFAVPPSAAGTNFDFSAGNLNLNAKNMGIGADGNVTFTGTVTPDPVVGYNWGGNSGTLTLGANASVGAVPVTYKNGGTVVLTGTQSYTGVTTISGANMVTSQAGILTKNLSSTGTTNVFTRTVLEVSSLGNGGSASSLGASTADAANLVINGGTLRYTGAVAGSTDRLFTIGAGGATLEAAGAGTMTVGSAGGANVNAATGAVTMTLSGTNAGDNTLGSALADGALVTDVLSVAKTGTGKWILSANNTYTGATNVSAGTLLINGTHSGTGAVSVAAGATLGGTGSVAGNVTVVASGAVAPGASVGTFTAGGNATFDAGSNLDIEIASASSYDQLVVSGAGTFNGNVNVSLLGSFVPASSDVFTIISGTNVTGAVGNLNGQGKLDVPGGTFEVEFSAAGLLLKNFALAFLKGDMNADNAVNNQDIAPFVLALTNYPQYQVEYPGLDGIARGDINLDSVLNNQDIAPFVALLTGLRPLSDLAGDPDFAPLLSLVPEPASLSLLALGGLALRRRRA